MKEKEETIIEITGEHRYRALGIIITSLSKWIGMKGLRLLDKEDEKTIFLSYDD